MIELSQNKILLTDCLPPLFKEKYGCYVIVADVNQSFHRIQGLDEKRILYIGSGKLKNRLVMFNKVISKNRIRGHSGAVTYVQRNNYVNLFPLKKLYAHYSFSNSKEDALNQESNLLSSYEEKFGELPPLNKTKAKNSMYENLRRKKLV